MIYSSPKRVIKLDFNKYWTKKTI